MDKELNIREEMNFRDFGGYRSVDGRTVKKNTFYRSAALGLFNEEELAEIEALNIQTIIDFRSKKKADKLPDPDIEGANNIHVCAAFENFGEDLNYSPKEFFSMLVDEDQHGNAVSTVISSILSSLVYSNEAYKTMFNILKEQKTPLLIHCSQGKDRTGIGAILILLALGVPETQIIHDYLLTNEQRKPFIDDRMEDFKFVSKLSSNARQAILAIEGVIPESVHMLLAEILERYDTYEHFLFKEYGLDEKDIQYLRDIYLEGEKNNY